MLTCKEGYPDHVVIEAGTGRDQATITGETVSILKRIDRDVAVVGALVEAIDSTGTRTFAFALNLKDTRTQDWWYHTGRAGGGLVPGALVLGSQGLPYLWPAPRILRKGETLECLVKAAVGTTICYFRLVLIGQRLKSFRGKLRDKIAIYDQRSAGYTALVFDALSLTKGAAACEPGNPQRRSFLMGSLPYDVLVQEASFIVIGSQAYAPASGTQLCDVKFRDTSEGLDLTQGWIPSSYFGGQNSLAGAGQFDSVRSVASELGARWWIGQDRQIEMVARAVETSPQTVSVQCALHGQRIPPRSENVRVDQIARDRGCVPAGHPFGGGYAQ